MRCMPVAVRAVGGVEADMSSSSAAARMNPAKWDVEKRDVLAGEAGGGAVLARCRRANCEPSPQRAHRLHDLRDRTIAARCARLHVGAGAARAERLARAVHDGGRAPSRKRRNERSRPESPIPRRLVRTGRIGLSRAPFRFATQASQHLPCGPRTSASIAVSG